MNFAIRSHKGYLVDTNADGPEAVWSEECGDDCCQFDERADAHEVIATHFTQAEVRELFIRAELVEEEEE